MREIKFPHTLGLLYSAFTYYTGFKVNSGEYKVMGLAPYGEPQYCDLHPGAICSTSRPDGSFWLDLSYFNYCDRPDDDVATSSTSFSAAAARIRKPAHPARHGSRRFHAERDRGNHAAHDARARARTYGIRNLCMAGGVALNCVANGKILRDGQFDRIWVQPAAGDAGGALGAALAALSPASGQCPRHVERRARLHARLLSRPGIRARRYRAAADRARRALRGAGRRRHCSAAPSMR